MNVLLLTLLTAGVELQAAKVEAIGWSQDSRYFLASTEGGVMEVEYPITRCDAQTGRCDETQPYALTEWRAKHPLAPLAAERQSPDGKATFDVKPMTGKVSGGWNATARDDWPANFTWAPAVATGAE